MGGGVGSVMNKSRMEGSKTPIEWLDYVNAAATVAACTILSWTISAHVHPRNLLLIYLIGITVVSNAWCRGAAIFACILSVCTYDFFFVPPIFQMVPSEREYWFTLGGMLIVAMSISSLAARLKNSAKIAADRARAEHVISNLNRAIASTRTVSGFADAAATQLQSTLGRKVRILLCDAETHSLSEQALSVDSELDAALKTISSRKPFYDNQTQLTYFPLLSVNHILGVLVVYPTTGFAEDYTVLQSVAEQLTFGLDRAIGIEAAEKAKVRIEVMKLRNALLSSVSHDLRTPLASIMGAATSILSDSNHEIAGEHKELVQSIYQEADRLGRFLKNLLDMTRIESGAVQLKKEWLSIEESVGVALNRLKRQLAPFKIVTRMPDELTMNLYDEQLIDQVLFNLLDNSAKYAPPGSEITVFARKQADGTIVGVSNLGCTLPVDGEAKMFDKFYRGDVASASYGAGLGLTICKGIMQAHGGQIWAERFDETGISICFMLPNVGEPPTIALEESTAELDDNNIVTERQETVGP